LSKYRFEKSDGTKHWWCLYCQSRHYAPGRREAKVCPALRFDDAMEYATDYVERQLALAHFDYPGIRKEALLDLAREIDGWSRYQWGSWLRHRYISHPRLGAPLLEAMTEQKWVRRARGVTAAEADLVVRYLPLVGKLARIKSQNIIIDKRTGGPVRGYNDEIRPHLEALGMEVLEQEVKKFDPTVGVTFGAFVRSRLNGAMNNYLKRKRIKTVSYMFGLDSLDGPDADEAIDLAKKNAKVGFKGVVRSQYVTGNAPKRHRNSTGGYKATSYLEQELAQHAGASHLLPADDGATTKAVEAAAAMLSPRERTVYIGRVLSNPPKPRADLAHELGIRDVTQISRIARRAKARMAKLLAA
jgi:DNA-directed RNA polymerase specialized sigma subunit